ncbi:MAG: polymorphic toxin-type HINT domain-containing protein [Acidimicrobiales bacterium]
MTSRRAAELIAVILAALVGIFAPVAAEATAVLGTTAATAVPYTYDGHTMSHGDVYTPDRTVGAAPQLSDVREGPASTPAAAARASTTPGYPSTATEGGAGLVDDLATACHSFDRRTEVVMADGTRRQIGDVKVGDRVRTTDPKTGKTVVRPVTALHINRDTDLADLTIRDATGNESTIHTTQHHKFWDNSRNTWVDAGDLRAGERLHNLDGDVVTVAGVVDFDGFQTMYDLTIDGVHTYYVEAGDAAVLVHNCGGLNALSQSGSALDPADAGGQLTRAGRAFAKAKEVFGPTAGGPTEVNAAGQNALDEILTNPGTVVRTMQGGNFAGGRLFISPNGVGAVFGPDGTFQYFGWMTP